MSKIEVNTVDVQCGSTLTLGSSGKTVTLATGASQSGFGRTGTVDWCTTVKTSPLTAVSGNGYFINTTAGVITVTLPSSPTAGDIVALKDYASTWNSNAVTVGRAGSKIGGQCNCATLDTQSQSVTLIYVDGTQGWQDIHDSTANVTGAEFVAATGGTITTVCTDYKVHTFNASGCFQVTNAGNAGGSNTVDYMVVAGGGGGTSDRGGGGGAGGFRESSGTASGSYTASPLGACVAALPVSVSTYPITVGGGGAGGCSPQCGIKGSNSVFSTITSTGGGFGLYNKGSSPTEGPGGSGGGAGYGGPYAGGAGNTPPVSPSQGFPGGTGSGSEGGAGGGGATVVGGNPSPPSGGIGGTGATTSINSTPTARAGGGGGSSQGSPVAGGAGGGGTGWGGPPSPGTGGDGTVNTGGGGGGSRCNPGGAGGSGVVIIRYKFQ